jgi:hypothetical protein
LFGFYEKLPELPREEMGLRYRVGLLRSSAPDDLAARIFPALKVRSPRLSNTLATARRS